ncbi:MAG: haloacid dehalogenase type II [Gammaproteobacteria bacterium]|nr:haloacid dehalogenase type II [Gammaproteobacteria bacterium]
MTTTIGTPFDPKSIRALLFDVFGTVVDWRTGIAKEAADFAKTHGFELDAYAFADAWRGKYQPSMSKVRDGKRPWTRLDVLHRESLDELVVEFSLPKLDEEALAHLNRAWHRLPGWPDSSAGLVRLKKGFIIGTLSNGNTALMVNMGKHSNLPWDVILGAEPTQHYKPQPRTYELSAELLDLAPSQCLMVAAHNGDLVAAANSGLRTAFVGRPTEYGPHQTEDFKAEHGFDVVVDSMTALAEHFGL